ncbi:hypothetical protein P153DRAFT_220235 [Dothidotthia symphoricarpi CBS 119687]|uniref:Uncharacterized protein n=1 Tax=Dothidotthia symphoricarpi CBS 119687 TaxID=1392245 RepID=A0A6A6AG28_9PLEO|nr:uncharacterized protein P153DRAFT_220235 [Dothidotthia symphoricarpi CBS 119687]KAF2130526.1 hypothetical protein P153DRAFT_220235 [Dothidotthia symphoricarpi CBS 119687]
MTGPSMPYESIDGHATAQPCNLPHAHVLPSTQYPLPLQLSTRQTRREASPDSLPSSYVRRVVQSETGPGSSPHACCAGHLSHEGTALARLLLRHDVHVNSTFCPTPLRCHSYHPDQSLAPAFFFLFQRGADVSCTTYHTACRALARVPSLVLGSVT